MARTKTAERRICMDKKKTVGICVAACVAAFTAYCTAQSLIALRKALEEKEQREQQEAEN
jgi:hypothetical protein